MTEWFTHPGYPDAESGSEYDVARREDLELLLRPRVRERFDTPVWDGAMRANHARGVRAATRAGRRRRSKTPRSPAVSRGGLSRARRVVRPSRSSPEPLTRAAAASRSGPGTKRRRKPRPAAGGLEQLVQRGIEISARSLQVRHRVVVADQAEVDLAVVAHDPHAERLALGQRDHREHALHPAAQQVTAGTAGRGRW